MQFAKWNGIGNDYLVVWQPDDGVEITPQLASAICDRHFGVGGDGILELRPHDGADALMLVHNPDGSRSEMCGNGIRMVARYLADRFDLSGEMSIATSDGGAVHPTVLDDGRVRVDMGVVSTEGIDTVSVPSGAWTGRVLSVGNPHFCVAHDPATIDLEGVGAELEHHNRFPNRANIEFYLVDSPSHVTMRVWERGVGETLACGSGACAVGATAVLDGGCTSPVTVTLPGGDLEIDVADDLRVVMTGAAEHIYSGTLDPDALLANAPTHNAQEALA
jgi:diaminopimelate epimerase